MTGEGGGLKSLVIQSWQRLINSGLARVTRLPAAIAGLNIVSNNAAGATAYCANYIQVIAATAEERWVCGLKLGTPVVEAFYGDIVIATGAAGFEVNLATIPVGTDLFPVAEWAHPVIFLPQAIRVPVGSRLSVNIRKNTGASLAGFNNCAVMTLEAIGT